MFYQAFKHTYKEILYFGTVGTCFILCELLKKGAYCVSDLFEKK
jgi:hypothetical protein